MSDQTEGWSALEELQIYVAARQGENEDYDLRMLRKALAELEAVKAREEACVWTYDDYEDSWQTTCGNAFTLNDGKPSDNEMRFCGYCGHPLQEVIPELPYVGDEDGAASEPPGEEGT